MRRRKRKKNSPAPGSIDPASGSLSHHPFHLLKDMVILPKPDIEPDIPEPPARFEDDTDLFRRAMSEVQPIRWKKKRIVRSSPPSRPPEHEPYSEDLEVMDHLRDLVSGRIHFDLSDTDEYVEGYVRGMHHIVLEKLRRGHFSVQAYLDLHGLTVREAKEAVKDFISEAITLRYRCVLLIHGRGNNSKDQIPVLKKKLESILLRGTVRKRILAFTSAQPHDGGAGASYVLLRAKK